jgi:hypothetical protein
MTDTRVKEIMWELGKARPDFTLNPMKGTPGDFYREHRADDIELLCREVIAERQDPA